MTSRATAATAPHLRELEAGARWYREEAEHQQRQLAELRADPEPAPWVAAWVLRLEADIGTHLELADEYAARLAQVTGTDQDVDVDDGQGGLF